MRCNRVCAYWDNSIRFFPHREGGGHRRVHVVARKWGDKRKLRSELGLVGDDGQLISARRTPGGLAMAESQLRELLCTTGSTLASPLNQLCRTSIVRDEEITAFSVDLKETERFAFVRSALGAADFSGELRRLKGLKDLLREELADAVSKYDVERERTSSLGVRLSKARAEASRRATVAAGETLLREYAGQPEEDLGAVIGSCEARLVESRRRADQLGMKLGRLLELVESRARVATEEYARRRAALEERATLAEAEEARARTAAEAASRALAETQGATPDLRALAEAP